jgi:hypothetical protein
MKMEKINVAELLKDCPNGMELDCTMYEEVSFIHVLTGNTYPIKIETPDGQVSLDKYGCYSKNKHAKCVIFPKGKTTWEGFAPPCKFKDGDIIFTHTNSSKCNLDNCWVSIFKEYRNNRCACYVCLCLSGLELYHDKWEDELLCELCEIEESRLATEEEKERLFQAIKDNGYEWNPETKTLKELIKPRFKVGDKIKHKSEDAIGRIEKIVDNVYHVDYSFDDGVVYVGLKSQDDYELVPNKFDITTLKPFDKVLVRDNNEQLWLADLFGFYRKTLYPFMCVGHYTNQCIPYEGNEHLLGTTDDCDEYYKNW